jgi:hypothetical protein
VKKEYKVPTVRSLRIQEPLAFACNIYNAESNTAGCWSGAGVTTPTFICDGPPCSCP